MEIPWEYVIMWAIEEGMEKFCYWLVERYDRRKDLRWCALLVSLLKPFSEVIGILVPEDFSSLELPFIPTLLLGALRHKRKDIAKKILSETTINQEIDIKSHSKNVKRTSTPRIRSSRQRIEMGTRSKFNENELFRHQFPTWEGYVGGKLGRLLFKTLDDPEMTEMLIVRGANVKTSKKYLNPLEYGAQRGLLTCSLCRLYVSRGIDPSYTIQLVIKDQLEGVKHYDGETAADLIREMMNLTEVNLQRNLVFPVLFGVNEDEEKIKILQVLNTKEQLKRINTEDGSTYLHYVLFGQLMSKNIVKWLVEKAGIDVNVVNFRGKTALDYGWEWLEKSQIKEDKSLIIEIVQYVENHTKCLNK